MTKFREILRNQIHFRHYFVFCDIKKFLFRDHILPRAPEHPGQVYAQEDSG
jgi:hypothetical protein